ncbi:MAG: ABC transporter permease [Armatimonadota bacterium]
MPDNQTTIPVPDHIDSTATPEQKTPQGSDPAQQVTHIRPSKGLGLLHLRTLCEYRELLFFLTWRDIKVRYKQAALGVTWVVMQPVLTMLIFSIFFGRLAGLSSEGAPYPLFCFAALLPWQFFSGSLSRAGNSLVSNANLLTKIYFPRLVIPFSSVASGLPDFAISLLVLCALMVWYGVTPSWALLTLPFFILLVMMAALGVGLWLAALNVEYRDVQYIIPFLVQIWLFASPVAYSTWIIPEGPWRILYGLNPMVGIIQGFRWIFIGSPPPGKLLIASVLVVVFLLVTGLWNFKRMERTFADIV